MEKDAIMLCRVLNTPLLMTVARYWDSISFKTVPGWKKCPLVWKFKQKPLLLPNEMKRQEHLDETWPNTNQCSPMFQCFPVLSPNYSSSILKQYSLAYSEVLFENKNLHDSWNSLVFWWFQRGQGLISSLKITYIRRKFWMKLKPVMFVFTIFKLISVYIFK